MPIIWENSTLTNKGIALQAKTLTGDNINITSVKTGSGSVENYNLKDQTDVTDIEQVLIITSVGLMPDDVYTAKLQVLLTNNDLAESYNLRQIGIYATDPDEGEILFAIAQSTEAYKIPSKTESPGFSLSWTFFFNLSSETNINATIDPDGLITRAELESALSGIDMSSKADKDNPTMTGALSVNRKEDSEVGIQSVSIGMANEASGIASVAEGMGTSATGIAAHSAGYYTTAKANQMAVGTCNDDSLCPAVDMTKGTGTVFVVGNGNTQTKSNVLRVTYEGKCYGKNAFLSSGADYAEYFEWADGNPNAEDRRGYFVTLHGKKIAIANPGDFIAGIVSGNPSVIGNGDECWRGKYLHDDFGGPVMVDQEAEIQDPETGEFHTALIRTQAVNPEYDPKRVYTERANRKEWDAVGMVGVLRVRDDSTCSIDGYCTVSSGGIATASERGYRVLDRVSENVVEILFTTYAQF